MQAILPYTNNTAFNTQDAATIAKSGKNDSSSLWDSISKSASDVGDSVAKGASGAAQAVKDLWGRAKQILE